MVEAIPSATSSSVFTQSNADVRLRARALIVEGAQTGNLRAALKQVPKQMPEATRDPMAGVNTELGATFEQGKPSPSNGQDRTTGQSMPSSLDVKRRASSLMAEGARSGALRTALRQVSRPTPLSASNPSFELRVQDVSASQQGAAPDLDPAEQIPAESPQPTPNSLSNSLSGTSLGMASMRGTPSSLAGTASTRATPSSSHVRSRSKELLLEGARTGNLQAALKQVPNHTSQAIPNSSTGVVQGRPTSSDVKQRARALMMEGAKTGNLRAALKQIPKGTQQVDGTPQAIPEVAPEKVTPSASHVRSRSKELLLEGARTGNLQAALNQVPKQTPQVHETSQAIPKVASDEGQLSVSHVRSRSKEVLLEAVVTGNLQAALNQVPKQTPLVHETSQAIPKVAPDEGQPSVSHVRSRSKEVLLEGARTGNLQAALKQVPKQTPQAIPNSQTRQNQEYCAAAEQGQPSLSDVKQRAQALMMEGAKTGSLRRSLKQIPKQTLQAVQEPDVARNENTELKQAAERTVAVVVNSAATETATAAAAEASERAAEASERAVAPTEAIMAADEEGLPPHDSQISQPDCASQDADDAALRYEPAEKESPTELQQQTSSSQPKHESMAEEMRLDDARTEPADATETWIKRVRKMLSDESAAVPGRSLNSRKISPRKVRKALGLPDLSGRSHFAGISDDGTSRDFHMKQDGLETPPSPPAPSSDRSRYSAATPASTLRKSLSKLGLDMKIPEIPACGLKKSSPLSSDGSRKAAAARENQSAVPVLDMKKVHMGEDLDDIDVNTQNKSDRTGVACHGSTSNWDAGGSEDGTIPPSRREGDADDLGSRGDDNPVATNWEVRPQSGGGSGTPSKAGSKDIADAPAKLPELPPERSGAGPSPTAIALLGALHYQQADKTDWHGARPGAKAKASPKKTKSPFELPKKPKKPTPAELSSVRLSPMPGSKESKRSKSNGSKGRNPKAKLTGSKSLPGLPAIWTLGIQKIVHSHFHHHYHVFPSSEDAAPQADDGQEAEDCQQAEDGQPEEDFEEKNASEQPADGVGMEF